MAGIIPVPARVGFDWRADGDLANYRAARRQRAHRSAARAKSAYLDRFHFHEDWDGSAVSLSKWTLLQPINTTIKIIASDGGVLEFVCDNGGGGAVGAHIACNNLRQVKLARNPVSENYCSLVQTTECRPRMGFRNASVFDADSGIFFEYDSSASANWFGVTRSGANRTAVDLGVAADTAWRVFRFEVINSVPVVNFYISAAGVLSPIYRGASTTNIDASSLYQPTVEFFSLDGNSKTFDIDYSDFWTDRRTS